MYISNVGISVWDSKRMLMGFSVCDVLRWWFYAVHCVDYYLAAENSFITSKIDGNFRSYPFRVGVRKKIGATIYILCQVVSISVSLLYRFRKKPVLEREWKVNVSWRYGVIWNTTYSNTVEGSNQETFIIRDEILAVECQYCPTTWTRYIGRPPT